jgi:hypothetical protein
VPLPRSQELSHIMLVNTCDAQSILTCETASKNSMLWGQNEVTLVLCVTRCVNCRKLKNVFMMAVRIHLAS